MSAVAALKGVEHTPAERVAIARRARQIRTGEVVIPSACPECYSPSIERSDDPSDRGIKCLTCGRVSKAATVKKVRRQRLARFLRDGEGVSIP